MDQNVGNKDRSEDKNFPESIFYIATWMHEALILPSETSSSEDIATTGTAGENTSGGTGIMGTQISRL